MRTFALKNGDLVLTGNRYTMVEGAARVQQQLGLGLREPYGSDRFHTAWGSMIPNWLGRTIVRGVTQDVRAEVLRVIRNHIIVQNGQLKDRATAALKPTITAEEIISEVTDIRFTQRQDELIVKVTIRTTGQQEFTLLTSTSGGL